MSHPCNLCRRQKPVAWQRSKLQRDASWRCCLCPWWRLCGTVVLSYSPWLATPGQVDLLAFGSCSKYPEASSKWLAALPGFCNSSEITIGCPDLPAVVDFLEALAEGLSCDSGSRRAGAARGVVRALRFTTHKLELDAFSCILRGPVVAAWLSAQKWFLLVPSADYSLCVNLSWLRCPARRWQISF